MNIDWVLLKKPLLTLGILISLGGVGTGVLWLRYKDTQHAYLQAGAERKEALVRYQRAESDLALFQQYKQRFLEYKRQGVIGQENRLSWAEVLHKQDLALSLPVFDVQISPRQSLYKTAVPPTIKWFKSTQSIVASLLHEVDLLQIFQALEEEAEGVFRIASCKLQRAQKIQLTPQAANIHADCTLQWYSLHIATTMGGRYVY